MRFCMGTWRNNRQGSNLCSIQTRYVYSTDHCMGQGRPSVSGMKSSGGSLFGLVLLDHGLTNLCLSSITVDWLSYLLVFVDDIVVMGSTLAIIDDLTRAISQVFAMKKLEPLYFFLGIKVSLTDKTLVLTQCQYVLDLLQWINMIGAKPIYTPMAVSLDISISDGVPLARWSVSLPFDFGCASIFIAHMAWFVV